MHLEATPSDSRTIEVKPNKSSVWLYLTIAILFIPLAVTVYLSMHDNRTGIVAQPVGQCHLQQGPCEAVFHTGGKVTLSMSPRPIQELKRIRIKVRLQGIDAKSVYVDFRGQNMYMGYNRPKLEKLAPGQFSGSWTLASCGLDVEHMIWQTVVLIQTNKQRMSAPFMLETQPTKESVTQ